MQNLPALMFVELPTLNGGLISIEASKIVAIRQDERAPRHAWVDAVGDRGYSITFPELETDSAREEILLIMHQAVARALVPYIAEGDEEIDLTRLFE